MQYVLILQKQSLGGLLKNSCPGNDYCKISVEMIIVKYLCWSLFLNHTAGCRPETLLKRYSGTGASC